MRSLFLKFFLSFFLVIALMIGAAALIGFLYGEQLQKTIEDFEVGDSMKIAAKALDTGGRAELLKWRDETPRDDGVMIFILDEQGKDISGRHIPFTLERIYQRLGGRAEELRRSNTKEIQHNRLSLFLPQLQAPSGEVFTFLVAPEAFWANQDIRVLLLIFAVLISGLVSYGLAAAFSRPVRKLRDATLSLAEGNLDARVAKSVGKRRDELGMLGRDFDAMADKLERAAIQMIELLGNISHELRSPLARMRVAVELARRKTGEMTEFDRLDHEAERLDSLIGQILSYTKLEADSQINPEKIDLDDIVSEVAENVNFEWKQDRVAIESNAIDASTIGFRGAILGAVENVVRNAVTHSPPDSKVIIKTSVNSTDVQIKIIDDGPGVPSQDLERLFEPFFRTRQSTEADANGGVGLGLAIAHRAITLHNGYIEARNGVRTGLVVTISLPIQD